MIWQGVSRSEWLSATLVAAASLASAVFLHWSAARVDAATDLRREQMERLAELAAGGDRPPAAALLGLEGLFAGHELVAECAPWGSCLALRSASASEVAR